MHFTDPSVNMKTPKIQGAESVGYCLKGTRAIWEYYPDEVDNKEELERERSVAPANAGEGAQESAES